MAKRRKSIDMIYAQLRRIGQMGGANNGSGFYSSSRGRRAYNAANRYATNISNARGMTTTRNGIPFVNNTKPVSRSTYMGLSNG